MSETFEMIRNRAGELSVFTVEVTPELASELLTLNDANRPLKRRLVKTYAQEMKKGHWKFAGDSIRLSKNHKLQDGQHRLTAIIESQVPQLFNIQTGLDDNVFAVIDTGRTRTSADVLSIKGYRNASALGGAIRLIIYHDRGLMQTMNDHDKGLDKNQRVTHPDILDWLAANGDDEINECLAIATQLYHTNRLLTQSQIAGFLYMFSRSDVDKARYFMECLVTGRDISLEQNKNIFLLREKLIAWQIRRTATPRERFACLVKAWNAWVTQKPLSRLLFRAGEDFPAIIAA